jgi:AcrR family transcriptional regulator
MRDGKATRERIEQAAMGFFVSQGVSETTIRDIAQGAGVAEGALYRHYRGKDDLIHALFSRHYAAFAKRLRRASALFSTTHDKLEGMVEECCRTFDEERVLFCFLLLVQHHSIPHVVGPETPVDVVRSVIAHGMAQGELPPGDADLATALVMGIILQPATFKTYGRLPGPMLPLAARLTAACWQVLRA